MQSWFSFAKKYHTGGALKKRPELFTLYLEGLASDSADKEMIATGDDATTRMRNCYEEYNKYQMLQGSSINKVWLCADAIVYRIV